MFKNILLAASEKTISFYSIVRHLLTSRPFPPSPNLFLHRRTFSTTERQATCYTYTAPPSKSRLNRREFGALELGPKSIWVFFTYSRHFYGNKLPKVFLRSIEAGRRLPSAAPGESPRCQGFWTIELPGRRAGKTQMIESIYTIWCVLKTKMYEDNMFNMQFHTT